MPAHPMSTGAAHLFRNNYVKTGSVEILRLSIRDALWGDCPYGQAGVTILKESF